MATNPTLERLVQHRPHIRDRLRPFVFEHGDMFGETGSPIQEIVFPSSGLLSIVVPLPDGESVECATVGYEGAVGLASVLGSANHVNTTIGQIPGQGWKLKVADAADIADGDPTLTAFLFRHEQSVLAQAQQTAACNARHQLISRLASWLLRAQDTAGSNELLLTHEFLAQMLGAQRATVSVAAHILQDMHLISYRRGRIRILDTPNLESHSCGCHRAVSEQKQQLLGLHKNGSACAIVAIGAGGGG